jgi:hypothetical protein
MRLDAGARFTPADDGTLQLEVLVEASPSKRPVIEDGAPFVVIEPRVGVSIALNILPKRGAPPAEQNASPVPPEAVPPQPIFPQRR